MKEYIAFLATKHLATHDALLKKGKTYRSRSVAFENGYLMALRDIQDAIDQPEKNRQLNEAMTAFGKALKG